jgi:8-amino-7-oxononanoate synthase
MNRLTAFLTHNTAQSKATGHHRQLQETHAQGVQVVQQGVPYLSFCSNDYLGLIADGITHLNASHNFGAGASRLITGNHPLCAHVESALARYKKKEAALLFGSGYLANIGCISALMGKGDLIVMDKLSHACMIDGSRLSGAEIVRFRHNDMAHLEALLMQHRAQFRHCLIATETIFSMDGDAAPLPDLRALSDIYDAWLLVDDAHGFGLPHVEAHLADIIVGTCSKAIGTYGGYVAGSAELRDYLVNHARSFMFTTALPEALCAATLHALEAIATQPERATRVMEYARQLCIALGREAPASPIIPIIIGENDKAAEAYTELKNQGILTSLIRPPTVPPRTARLRISLSAAHTSDHVEKLSKALTKMLY